MNKWKRPTFNTWAINPMGPIVVDISPAVNSKAGLGRYAHALVQHLQHTWVGPWLHLFYNRRPGGALPADVAHLPARRVSLGYKPWRLCVWAGHLLHMPFDRLLPRDTVLFHATEHLLLPLRTATVLTVHDLIFEHFPQFHKPLNYFFLKRAMPLFVRRATAIIAVSETTRRDLCRRYGVSAERVYVVPEAPAPHFRPPPAWQVQRVRQHYGLPPRYLLTVGTIEPRKNFTRLLRAFESLATRGLVDALVIAGQRGWLAGSFFQALAESPVRNQVHLLGYVPDEDLPALYAGATLFVLPSLYEGFGLPLLEAMACGTPVAAARAGALPEVGGDAAWYFDPHTVEAIEEALHRCLTDTTLRQELIQRGRVRAARFSWQTTAQRTAEVYAQVFTPTS